MESPSATTIESIRIDIHAYLNPGVTLDHYISSALDQFKIDIEDKRGISFEDVYYNGAYLTTRNQTKCHNMLAYLTVSLVFRDYAIKQGQSTWWDLANEYEARYDKRLKGAKLDVDSNDDQTISDWEESQTNQVFLKP